MTPTDHQEHVKQVAETVFAAAPDWMTFYREVFGLHGVVRRTFRSRDSLARFEQTETYQEIQRMLRKLRDRGPVPTDDSDPTHVITVRIPKSLHDALLEEAHEHRTTMNKLCISKLVQFIDSEMVPAKSSASQKKLAASQGEQQP